MNCTFLFVRPLFFDPESPEASLSEPKKCLTISAFLRYDMHALAAANAHPGVGG